MRATSEAVNKYRVMVNPDYSSPNAPAPSDEDGHNGRFSIKRNGKLLFIVASDGFGWDHVSVSFGPQPRKCPNWDEMCFVKDLFFEPEEVVVQYHPAKSEQITFHNFCLHMWKPQGVVLPIPEKLMVGPNPGESPRDCLKRVADRLESRVQ